MSISASFPIDQRISSFQFSVHAPSPSQLANVKKSQQRKEVKFSTNFESGSIGTVKKIKGKEFSYQLSLRDDNNDSSLPENFRTWFYVKVENVPRDRSLELVIDRLGFPYYYLPVYSYDGKTWHRFLESEVQMSPDCSGSDVSKCRLTITKQFKKSTVWIARTFPYTTKDLGNFLTGIKKDPIKNRFVKEEIIGYTPKKNPIPYLTITDSKSKPKGGKKVVFIHARTHPAETGSSFLLEGLINAILSNTALGKKLRKYFIFHIIPMHNVDGIIKGNYRTDAKSQNLENRWFFDRQSPLPSPLTENAPKENKIIFGKMFATLRKKKPPIVLALNLHSSNSRPNDPHFFYPHFGADPSKYTEKERASWNAQINFIRLVASLYSGPIQSPPEEGGRGFLNSFYPETWWWYYAKHVIALTLETVYGRAGLGRWITEGDYKKLGEAVAEAIAVFDFSSFQERKIVTETIQVPVPIINVPNEKSLSFMCIQSKMCI